MPCGSAACGSRFRRPSPQTVAVHRVGPDRLPPAIGSRSERYESRRRYQRKPATSTAAAPQPAPTYAPVPGPPPPPLGGAAAVASIGVLEIRWGAPSLGLRSSSRAGGRTGWGLRAGAASFLVPPRLVWAPAEGLRACVAALDASAPWTPAADSDLGLGCALPEFGTAERGTVETGKALRLTARSAWPVTHTGVWSLEDE